MKRRELLSGSFCADFSWRTLSFILAALALVVCFPGRAAAQAGLTVGAPKLNPANGHYYQTVHYPRTDRVDRTFATALAAASASSFNGIAGHLLTVTSAEEQLFLQTTFARQLGDRQAAGMWMGASDAAIEGEWRWITGPEAGQLFWRTEETTPFQVFGAAVGFESWKREGLTGDYLEPNSIGEDFGTITDSGWGARPVPPSFGSYYRPVWWNDLAGEDVGVPLGLSSWVAGYVVEYSIPEPGSAWLALVGLAAVTRAARRRSITA